jgi:nucleotide-binding universal stress UspA family protein/CBS domain-containing protein
MKVKDVMTRHVETVRPDTTLEEAARRMRALDVGMIPVLDVDELVGVITDRDITVRASAAGINPKDGTVSSVMTRDVISCFEDQGVDEAAKRMAAKQVRRLVVLSRTGRLAGIVSLGDLAVDTRDETLAGTALEGVSAKPHRSRPFYRHMLITLDGSKLAEQVLPYVEALAEQTRSKVTVVRAITPLEAAFLGQIPVGTTVGSPPVERTPITEDMRLDAVEYLTAMQDRLKSLGLEVACEYPEGPPAEMIVQRARHLGVDLIAMTTHGRSGLRRAIHGSVAEQVLKTAPCPVLLVRATEE